jgi:hypothetical protein
VFLHLHNHNQEQYLHLRNDTHGTVKEIQLEQEVAVALKAK